MPLKTNDLPRQEHEAPWRGKIRSVMTGRKPAPTDAAFIKENIEALDPKTQAALRKRIEQKIDPPRGFLGRCDNENCQRTDLWGPQFREQAEAGRMTCLFCNSQNEVKGGHIRILNDKETAAWLEANRKRDEEARARRFAGLLAASNEQRARRGLPAQTADEYLGKRAQDYLQKTRMP